MAICFQVPGSPATIEQLMLMIGKGGSVVLGASPGATDFFIAGSLQAARIMNEVVFERITSYPGNKRICGVCFPYM